MEGGIMNRNGHQSNTCPGHRGHIPLNRAGALTCAHEPDRVLESLYTGYHTAVLLAYLRGSKFDVQIGFHGARQ